ncbi:MAG: tetratricopeptide repeat protein [Planctomycetota bacterium]
MTGSAGAAGEKRVFHRASNAPGRGTKAVALLSGLALVVVGFVAARDAAAADLAPRAHTAMKAPLGGIADKDLGKAALKEASAAKSAAQKLDGEARSSALQMAAGRYDAIAADEAFAPAIRAEASFRSGEILRSLHHEEAAEQRYSTATALGQAVPEALEFAARGLLERAHMARRGKDVEAALSLYGQVRERFSAHRRSAAHAMTWMGKLQLKAGQREQAAQLLQGFAEAYPEYPVEAIRNADLLAVEQLEAGDETAARTTVERVQAAMEAVLAAGGKTAEAVRKALDGMRVTEQLAGD